MNRNEDDLFSTSDFYSAVVLRSFGFPLLEITGEAHKATFTFERVWQNSTADAIMDEYWNRELQVNARLMVEAISELKTRLFAFR